MHRASAHAVFGYLQSVLDGQHGDAVSDRELLERFTSARDDAAFTLLLRRHGPMVFGLARRVVGDLQTAEDIVQATFVTLARKAASIHRAEGLACWLHAVALRLALRARHGEERLRPVEPASAEQTGPLIRALDAGAFQRREQAMKRLRELGPRAEPALQAALKAKPSPEVTRRIRTLLAAPEGPTPLSAAELRELRAVAVLERAGTANARRLLRTLAAGAGAARLTRQAQAAGARIERQSGPGP
jgi:DNA-directed RNA polymerase specialized sigma24 family protein